MVGENVVAAIHLVETRSLEHPDVAGSCEHLLAFDLARSIGRELSDTERRVAICHVHDVVLVNEHPGVVITLVEDRLPLPGPLNGRRRVDVGLGELGATSPIERLVALAVSEERGPGTLDVGAASVHIVGGREVQRGQRVPDIFPMDEVVGTESRRAGRVVHVSNKYRRRGRYRGPQGPPTKPDSRIAGLIGGAMLQVWRSLTRSRSRKGGAQ